MRDPHLASYLRVLELPPCATAADVQGAFRRLARAHHPDVNRFADRDRFVEIVRAYRALRDAFADPDAAHWGPCVACGRHDDLFDPLGHGGCCAECLLGATARRRMLPGPKLLVVIAKHLTVFGLYSASVLLLLRLLRDGDWKTGALALACAVAGFAVLMVEVVLAEGTREPVRVRGSKR